MGKLKKNSRNSRIRRAQQKLGKSAATSAEGQGAGDELAGLNKIAPLIQKLSSSAPNDRSMALSAIAVLCEDENLRKTMLKEKLVNILIEQCLNDNNDEIVVESFGLLRNLVIDEGYDVAKFLLRSKILVSIEANMTKAAKSFDFLNTGVDAKKDEKQVLFDYAENLVGLITGLSTVDQELFEEIYPQIDFAIKFCCDLLNWNLNDSSLKIPLRLLSVLLDFIYQLSNQSTDFINKVSSLISLEKLVNFKDTCQLNNLSKVYIEALKFHFSEVGGISNRDEFVYNSLKSIFDIISPINVQIALDLLATPETADKIDKEDSKKRLAARNDLESIDVALDLVATLIEFNASTGDIDKINEFLLQFYLQSMVPALIQLLSYKDQSFLNKSLICLNNLSWLFYELDTKPVSWFETLSNIWQIVFVDFVSLQESSDVESMTDYLKLLWIITKSLKQSLQGQISNEQITKILQRSNNIHECLEDVELIKSYFASLIGFLSSVAMIQHQADITNLISNHLIHLIKSSIDIINNDDVSEDIKSLRQSYLFQLIIVESISSMFEIFGDKEYDYDAPVYVGNNYNDTLASLEKDLKPIYKKIDKNKDAALRLQAGEVLSVLNRFIAYKRNESNN